MLSATLGRYAGNGSLHDLEKRLLYALAGYVPGDRYILALFGDLVDLVNINNTELRPLHVIVGGLQKLKQDVLHILAHISGLRQRGGVGDGKGDVDDFGQRAGQIGFPRAGGPKHDDVALFQLHIIHIPGRRHPLVMVVDGHRQNLFRLILPDHVVVQEIPDLHRL